MKFLNRKAMKLNKNLRDRRGETIMEAIVSLMILGILLTTLMTIVRFSMAITENAIEEAADAQVVYNVLINTEFSGTGGTITFTPVTSPGAPVFTINPSHAITISTADPDIIAFRPPSPPTGGG